MSFREIQNLQIHYNSFNDNVIESFYIPCLKNATIYKRSVGFFSSNILIQITKGLGAFADNGGKMKLLVSPELEEKDYEAIKSGYNAREILEKAVVDKFDFNSDDIQANDRFKMLAYLISSRLLEIKIVALEQNNQVAMFHEKKGILKDDDDNIISFSGSANETSNGYINNYEEFDVFKSWESTIDEERCNIKDLAFDRVWNNTEKGLITIDLPDIIKHNILKYNESGKPNFTKLDEDYVEILKQQKEAPPLPYCNEEQLYDYQIKAIDEWEKHDYKGIFDMATGTGKTFTGAGAICRLFKKKKRLIAIICCPFTHLVDQWCEELKVFNIQAIKCYGSVEYRLPLKRAFNKFKHKSIDFLCAVICNASFLKDEIQNEINDNLSNTLLVVDEAHNFGSYNLSKSLEINYPYRLALSATLERYGDEEGTKKLFNFFGEKCIEYTLERALAEGKLCRYEYFPIVISLTDKEYNEYVYLSKKIGKLHSDGDSISEEAKRLLIKRARIVAGARNKVTALFDKLKEYQNEYNVLVYCGAVKYGDYDYEKCNSEKKQIKKVVEMMNVELKIIASKFTSEENAEKRKEIIRAFKEQELQAMVAIKCLDEGMNIPAIKTAFILASSTNPKEYIQRRGRVLRNFEGKEYATIYDFITIPVPLDAVSFYDNPNLAIDKNLIRKELSRLQDFASLSMHPSYSNNIIDNIKSAFRMDIILEEEEYYE